MTSRPTQTQVEEKHEEYLLVAHARHDGCRLRGWDKDERRDSIRDDAADCHPSAPPTTSAALCTPSGTTLQISTGHPSPAYDKDCLAAPANTAFKIDFDNKDSGVEHNVSVYTDAGASTVLLKGKIITGPEKITYHVKALPAGTYYFRCDVHVFARMSGTFVVSG